MKLTFVTDLGQSFVVEIDPDMELENVMALLEAEVRTLFVSEPLHQNSTRFVFSLCSQGSLSPNRVFTMKAGR